MDDSFSYDKSILESLKNKQNLIVISFFKYLRKLNIYILLNPFELSDHQQKKGTSGFCVEILSNKDQKDFYRHILKICHWH